MSEQIEVKLDFINKKHELKHVKFFMDKTTYKILFDKSVSEEIRHQYLIDEYHAYEKERYHQRKFVSFDEAYCINKEEKYDFKIIKKAINKLSSRQKEIIFKVYFEDKKQIEVAKELNVTRQFISKTLSKSMNKLKIMLEKEL
ncbi:putative RNA polymerase sigma-70 region 4 [Firmicutes bacterium CAG:449]|nr:putative RNA polymerase sigma-70 region 4 [Firmicutes bacterium CAG:449]